MTTTTLSLTETTRLKLQNLDTTPGLPKLPHVPENWGIELSPQQQEENLLHVALWIVERDQDNFYMGAWHKAWKIGYGNFLANSLHGRNPLNECGTVHCIAGFAQVMAGEVGFCTVTSEAGHFLLGDEACSHFRDSNEEGLAFLKEVITRNS